MLSTQFIATSNCLYWLINSRCLSDINRINIAKRERNQGFTYTTFQIDLAIPHGMIAGVGE